MQLTEDELARLCEKHRGLAVALARRYLSRSMEWDDLLQVASIGLVRALRGFDETRGLKFSTYAVAVIDGEIRSALREGGALRVSRSIRRNAAHLLRAAETLGEDAPLSALAEAAGLDPDDAALALGALQAPACLDGEEMCSVASYEIGYDAVLDRVALEEGMACLPARDRALLDLRYRRHLTQQQTARVLNMTQVQVSRAEKRILLLLREKLSA